MTQVDLIPPPADDQMADLHRENPDPTPVARVTIQFSAIARAWRWIAERLQL